MRILAACLALATWGTDQAPAATLQALFAGATIDAGNARFSNWQLTSLDATAAAPNLAMIDVTAWVADPANPGLQFAAGGQLATMGPSAIDLTFSYRVQAIGAGASFVSDTLAMTGITFGGPGGLANITQDTNIVGGGALGTAVAFANHEDDVFQFNATANHAPRLAMNVTVNIFMQGISATDTISLTAFTQRFSQAGATTLLGDFNLDKQVDGADFLVWQRGGSPTPLSTGDLNAWRANFGASLNATPTLAAVPEPGVAALLAAAAAGLAALSRRCARRPAGR